jgi:hypothetical protein
MLSLKDAIQQNRLSDFIEQEESRGVSTADRADFDRAVKLLATPQQSKGRTSRSAARGGSGGK